MSGSVASLAAAAALARGRGASDESAVIPGIAEDGSLFPIGKLEAHRRGQKHLAISVFLFAGDQLLIQRRAFGKYHSGGLWANTCCSHPNWQESPSDCARRRLFEELGIAAALTPCAVIDYAADVGDGMVENERVHIFQGEVAAPFAVSGFNRDEVQDTAWVAQPALRQEAAREPGRFTPWIRIYLDRWSELLLPRAA